MTTMTAPTFLEFAESSMKYAPVEYVHRGHRNCPLAVGEFRIPQHAMCGTEVFRLMPTGTPKCPDCVAMSGKLVRCPDCGAQWRCV